MIKFKENLGNPFCLECLKNKKKFVKTKLVEETGDFYCSECGLFIEKEYFERIRSSRERPSPFPYDYEKDEDKYSN